MNTYVNVQEVDIHESKELNKILQMYLCFYTLMN